MMEHEFKPDHNLNCEECGQGELAGEHGMIPGPRGTPIYADPVKRRVAAIRQLLAEEIFEALVEQGYTVPAAPERYLLVATVNGEVSHAQGDDSLTELARWIDHNQSYAADEIEVHDLDNGTHWIPTTQVTAFIGFKNPPNTGARIDVLKTAPVDEEWRIPPYEATDEEQKFIDYAREEFASDEIEIDDNPGVSQSEDGAFVGAWLWVTNGQAGLTEECNQEGCGTQVKPDDLYYATPCGTYCYEHIGDHAKECGICASEFDLEGPEGEDGQVVILPELKGASDDE